MVVTNMDFIKLNLGFAVALKVAYVAKSGTPDDPKAFKPLLIDLSSPKHWNRHL